MPQIWLTYEEAGAYLGCSDIEARSHAIGRQWDRKQSRDGLSRLKLPEDEAARFMDSFVREALAAMEASSLPVRRLQEEAGAFFEEIRKSA